MPADFGDVGGDAAPLGDAPDRREHIGDGEVAGGVVAGADVDREFARPGDDVDGALRHGELADGADQRRGLAAAFFDGENDFGGGGRRIVPQRHRHRAGMAGHATDRDPKACRSGNRGDDPERQAALQQHRPLLDVNFEITAQRFRPARQRADRRQIGSLVLQERRQTDAVGVATLQYRRVETAGDGGAAEIGRGKSHAFLLGKADHIEMEGQVSSGMAQMLGDDEPGQDTEASVEPAGIDHGIVVRADDQRFRASRWRSGNGRRHCRRHRFPRSCRPHASSHAIARRQPYAPVRNKCRSGRLAPPTTAPISAPDRGFGRRKRQGLAPRRLP